MGIDPTPPSIPPEYAQELITRQLTAGQKILDERPIDEGDLDAWKNTKGQYLIQAFGSHNANVFNFSGAGSITKYMGMSDEQIESEQAEALESQLKYLESALEQLDAQLELDQRGQTDPPDDQTSLSMLEDLLSRFHLVVRQLGDRHDSRATLNVNDEYDVQDLLHALLRLFFDDIRPEEWTPSYAGGSARMDFLIKQEEIVIETKMTRENLTARDIGNQLIEDIARYKEHQDCRVLIAFVYDPEGRIANPRGIENDLSRDEGDLAVRVMIVPQGV